MTAAIRRLQATLESIYKVEVPVDAADFVVDSRRRAHLEDRLGARLPPDREALWILQEADDEVSVALVVDDDLFDADVLDGGDLDRHCALLEGVSHFVYFIDRATSRRPLTLLEMELQAEVDKFLTTWLAHLDAQAPLDLDDLTERLFVRFRVPERAARHETERYLAANRLAWRYCDWLARTYFRPDRLEPLWPELRRFWRMGHSEKIAHIESR